MKILGLHHITLVCTNAQRTVDFYVKVLRLRMIKQTVNFDDPGSYHLYFGDSVASPGTAITFFEWPHVPRGRAGIGGTHHFALTVADEQGLLKWKRYLQDQGIAVQGPYDRRYFRSIYFKDPDGVNLEIATRGPGWLVDESAELLGTSFKAGPENTVEARNFAEETWPEPMPAVTKDMALQFGMHHITAISSDIQRTDHFFREVLGMRLLKMTENFDQPGSAHWYWGVDEGKPGTLITYFEHKPGTARRVEMGAGLTHHFALAVQDEAEQQEWRQRLAQAGFRVTDIQNRDYFRSIYTNDPDGHIVELATVGPGFAIDEDIADLGMSLQLPDWLEQHRPLIEARLKPLDVSPWEGFDEA